jgi:hypothetical protein
MHGSIPAALARCPIPSASASGDAGQTNATSFPRAFCASNNLNIG